MFTCGPAFFGAAAGAAATPHRYWRLLPTANNGHAYTALAALQMRTTLGGADVAEDLGGAGAIGNDSIGTMEPYRAFDANLATVWATNAVGPWVGKDFGAAAGGWKSIVQIVLQAARSAEGGPTQTPKDFQLQYSDNASAWTTVLTKTNETGWAASESRTFNV